ncbi:MAG: hypothetical protein EOP82_06605 [Variovorax sp.]|nr:MAG: hypothetical protein EOP82_06605 [Variovorax sp.]
MNDVAEAATPKEKLAHSRAALLAAMGFEEVRTGEGERIVESVPQPPPLGPLASRLHASWLGRWWRKQPAHSAVALIEPGLQRYASRNPWRLVTYAAGAGCALLLLKPWRLLSAGAVITLLLRSSDIAGAVSTYLHGHTAGRGHANDYGAIDGLRSGGRDDRF